MNGTRDSLALLAEVLPRGLRTDLQLAFLAHGPAVYPDETLTEVIGEGQKLETKARRSKVCTRDKKIIKQVLTKVLTD